MSSGASPRPAGCTLGSVRRRRQRGHLGDVRIQSFGALLVVREPDLAIVQASVNAPSLLGWTRSLLGCSLDELGGDLAEQVRSHLGRSLGEAPLALRCRAGVGAGSALTLLLHRPASGGLLIELEPAGPERDLTAEIQRSMQAIMEIRDLARLCDRVTDLFKEITGYDRVLVFRFDEEGQGDIVAERREPGVASCLGQSLPDVELPQQAHALILSNRVRHLVDAEGLTVPIRPRVSPVTGRQPDLSRCACREMSTVHLQFLGQIGVRGTLIVSLMVGERLWGLVVCHHRAPRFLHYETRALCELLAEAMSTRITALEGLIQVHAEQQVRLLEERMVEAVSRDGDWVPSVLGQPEMLLAPLAATGAVLVYEGKRLGIGDVPDARRLTEILAWLDSRPRDKVIATVSLGRQDPAWLDLAEMASGLLAVPLSDGGEYLIWLRGEARVDGARRDTCADLQPGQETMTARVEHEVMAPRFAWSRGRSLQWSSTDRFTARLFGESIADVIHQFRSVRVLIAQAQLAQARSQLSLSGQLVLIADPDGRILLATQAWERLLGPRGSRLESLRDLIALCAEPLLAEHRIGELTRHRRPWREQIGLRVEGVLPRPFLVRADPVCAPPHCLLGYVVMLSEVSETAPARALEARFKDVDRNGTHRVEGGGDAVYGGLLAAILGNARLAAQQAANPIDPARHASIVEGVESSVERTLDLLERLIGPAGRRARPGPNPKI